MARRSRKSEAPDVSLGQRIIEGLDALHECLRKGQKLEDRFAVRRILLKIQPPQFSAARVRSLRRRMGMSQAVFAQTLAVSRKTVELWEREGVKTPMARRLLQAIEPWWASVGQRDTVPARRPAQARRKKAG
jgi:DNA-binding transcriptional regulator YiaG